jgi:Aerotolerance regulator N-terminal/CARDB
VTFVQPLFLWGLTAAAIPLLIHLFNRRKPKQIEFAAIAFVLKSQKRTASRLRLKKFLLWLSRTLMLLALPLALAQPSCAKNDIVTAPSELAATVLVVDTSFAARMVDGTKSVFAATQREAKRALGELRTEEPALLLPCGARSQRPGVLGFERAQIAEQIDALEPSYETADYNQCLAVAARALEDSALPGRRIVLIGPLWTQALKVEIPPPLVNGPNDQVMRPSLVLRPIQDGTTLSNLSLIDLKASAAQQGGPRTFQFVATVRNFGADAQNAVQVELLVDDVVVSKAFVDVAGNGSAQKVFNHRFAKGGTQTVTVKLRADALVEDDARQVLVAVPEALKALIVNGSPNAQKMKDEAFFLDAALSESASPVRPVVKDPEAAFRDAFDGYDVVYLLNVEPPDTSLSEKLNAFLKRGGGVFVAFGDRLTPENLGQWSSLLPRAMRVVKTAVEPGAPEAVTRAARLATVDIEHPLLTPFVGRAREGLMSTRVFRYALFESSTSQPTQTLATLDDGAAALWTARVGEGRLLVFASTFDTDWTDFAIRTAFLPFAQRTAGFLTGTLDERERFEARVGEPLEFGPTLPTEAVRVDGPKNVRLTINRKLEGAVSAPAPVVPGMYQVVDSQEKVLEGWRFPVHLPESVGDVARWSVDNVKDWFGRDVVQVGGPSGDSPQTPLWTWLLVALVVAFVGEGMLTAK